MLPMKSTLADNLKLTKKRKKRDNSAAVHHSAPTTSTPPPPRSPWQAPSAQYTSTKASLIARRALHTGTSGPLPPVAMHTPPPQNPVVNQVPRDSSQLALTWSTPRKVATRGGNSRSFTGPTPNRELLHRSVLRLVATPPNLQPIDLSAAKTANNDSSPSFSMIRSSLGALRHTMIGIMAPKQPSPSIAVQPQFRRKTIGGFPANRPSTLLPIRQSIHEVNGQSPRMIAHEGARPAVSIQRPIRIFAKKAARKTAAIESSGEDSELEISQPESRELPGTPQLGFDLGAIRVYPPPPPALAQAFNEVTKYGRRIEELRRVPFLRRSLRIGFVLACKRKAVIDVVPKREPDISLEVNYYLDNQPLHHTARASRLFCPLCNFHGRFRARVLLDAHLKWDHPEAMSQWTQTSPTSWRIVVTLLTNAANANQGQDVDDDGLEYVDEEPPPAIISKIPKPREPPAVRTESPISPPIVPPTPSLIHPIKQRAPSPSPFDEAPLTTQLSQMEVSPVEKRESMTPPPIPLPSPSHSSRSVTLSPQIPPSPPHIPPKPKVPRPPDLPERCPTPPPKSNHFGPAAQYPYLPFKSEYGGPTVYYSCRPNGPKLYDLLATLPLDQFGVLAWSVVDREEDMFEVPHKSDECKVMDALWARWMMLHKREFIADYFKGTIAFIDEYWKMIHRAAGFDVLRDYLLILLAGKFLKVAQVAKALQHYEDLVGMKYWEK